MSVEEAGRKPHGGSIPSEDSMSVEEAVQQLEDAVDNFKKESSFYLRIFSNARAKIAWQNLLEKCRHLSAWIEHGKGVNDANRPGFVEKLRSAERLLNANNKYSDGKGY